MKKVVINTKYGGFDLSQEALDFMGIEEYPEYDLEFREDPKLVECVETLGKKANTSCSNLVVKEIPDNAEWDIEDHDGAETLTYECIIDIDKLMSLKTKDEVVKYLDENEILHN